MQRIVKNKSINKSPDDHPDSDALNKRFKKTRTALPKEWIQDKYKEATEGKLHPKKKRKVVTRREITGQRISSNIQQFNSPTLRRDHSDLHID